MGCDSGRHAVLAAAVCMALAACGGSSNEQRLAAGGAPSSGGQGQGGQPAIDTSRCFTLTVGYAIYADLDSTFSRVSFDSWIGSQRSTFYLGLSNPTIGTFDLSTLENLSWSLCTQCVSALRNDTGQLFQARSGSVELTSVGDVSSGRLSNVVLEEVTVDENREATVVNDGMCLVLQQVDWQTAACQVGGTCPEQMECLGSYYSLTAACVPRGDRAEGEACDFQAITTDCAAGLACVDGCKPTCSFWSEGTCPADMFCNADSRCIDPLANAAELGDGCPFAYRYCAAETGRYAGMCIPRGANVTCERLCRVAENDCLATETCEPFDEGGEMGGCTG